LGGPDGCQPKSSPPAFLSALGSEVASYPATVVSRHIDEEEEEEEDRAPFRLLGLFFSSSISVFTFPGRITVPSPFLPLMPLLNDESL
jgi:hypothetical protein